jgi:1,4-dihydroxy-2-naphthoate octaprenyltransferase
LLVTGISSAIVYTSVRFESLWQLIFLVTLPLFFINGKAVSNKPSHELDPFLKQMALSTLLFVVLFGLGLVLS